MSIIVEGLEMDDRCFLCARLIALLRKPGLDLMSCSDDMICAPCDEEESAAVPTCLPSVYQPTGLSTWTIASPTFRFVLGVSTV